MHNDYQPLLTIAIPTWNRAAYLDQTLTQLKLELSRCVMTDLQVLVSDNASQDETTDVILRIQRDGLKVTYIRNSQNIGSDANIAQCFNQADGKYVLILGDDDLFFDGALSVLMSALKSDEYGVVCLRPYGFNDDFKREYPGGGASAKVFTSTQQFLVAIGPLMTLISSCVINKSKLPALDALDYCGENLVQVHLVIRAVLSSSKNLYIDRYLIACKRNNSGGYDFSKVFVENLGNIMDTYQAQGLSMQAVIAIEDKLLMAYFPFYIFKQRLNYLGDIDQTYARFYKRYHGRAWFYAWNAPILKLPRPLALFWGAIVIAIGRCINGDLNRGIQFMLNKKFKKKSSVG